MKIVKILLVLCFLLILTKIDYRLDSPSSSDIGDDASYYFHSRTISEDFDFDYTNHNDSKLILERLKGATIAIINKVPMREENLKKLPDLKMIAVAATGTDVVDKEYCRDNNIIVSNIRGYAITTVPEHTFALILALMIVVVRNEN